MKRKRSCLFLLIGLLFSVAVFPAAATPQDTEPSEKPIGLSHDNRLRELLEAIQAHHIQPPTRQQMILETVKLAAVHQKSPVPTGFSARLSALSDLDAMYALMNDELNRSGASQLPENEFDDLMLSGLSKVVDGGFALVRQKDQKVNEQLAANRYVGIGIQVGTTPDTNEPRILRAMEGGTADEAGIKDDDVIEAVDGQPTKGEPLGTSIDRLRGPEGSTVKVTIRRDGESMDMEIVRRVVPIKTVQVVSERTEPSVVILRPDRIGASTVHEFRKAVGELEERVKTIIVDLRSQSGGSIHHLHLLADAILDEADCGFVETRTERRSIRTEAGTFCDGRQLAIVYMPGGSSRIDWLAATAAANGIAVFHERPWKPEHLEFVPRATPGTLEAYPIMNGTSFIELNASRMLMPDGSAASMLKPVGVAVFEDSKADLSLTASVLQAISGPNPSLERQTPDNQNKLPPIHTDDALLISRVREYLHSKKAD